MVAHPISCEISRRPLWGVSIITTNVMLADMKDSNQIFSANLGLLWADLPLIDRVKKAAEAGFKVIEFQFPYGADMHALRTLADEHDITICGINTPIAFGENGHMGLAAHPARIDDFKADFVHAHETAKILGASHIHVMAGHWPEEADDAMFILVENLNWASSQLANSPISIVIEVLNPQDMPNYTLNDYEIAAATLYHVDKPNIGLMLDAYHAAKIGHDPADILSRFDGMVGHIQLGGVPDRHEIVESDLDISALLSAIKQSDYAGHIGLEYHPVTPVADELRKLKTLWDSV